MEVETIEGRYGEFTVLLDGEDLISSGWLGFLGVLPSVHKVRELVKMKTAPGSTPTK
jgi:hypothetical protein